MKSKPSDLQIIERCLDGRSGDFRLLIERYQQPMYRTALGITGDPERAKDITQNGFIKAWEKLDTFDPNHRFFSWLYRIIVHEALNSNRAEEKFTSLNRMPPDSETPHLQVVKEESKQKLRQALKTLKPNYRTIIHLRHFEELSYREIAEILDIEEKTVKSRLYTARMNLRDALNAKS